MKYHVIGRIIGDVDDWDRRHTLVGCKDAAEAIEKFKTWIKEAFDCREARVIRITQVIADPSDELLASLGWIVEFVNEHDEWANKQFPIDSAEREWLETARAVVKRAEEALK